MRVQFDELHPPPLSLDVALIPYYTARTVLRMFIAFARVAAVHVRLRLRRRQEPRARARSCCRCSTSCSRSRCSGSCRSRSPASSRCFRAACSGVECASIFAIFTAQAWNMTFGFYHSLVTIPPDLQEAASVYQLNRWQRFTKVELPSSAIGLIWNSMMSFGGGWFFVAQSEAISVLNKNIKLPGLGSYMAAAVGSGRHARGRLRDRRDDRHHRRHRSARSGGRWSPGRRSSSSSRPEGKDNPTSWVLDLLQRSYRRSRWLSEHVGRRCSRACRSAHRRWWPDLDADAVAAHAPR